MTKVKKLRKQVKKSLFKIKRSFLGDTNKNISNFNLDSNVDSNDKFEKERNNTEYIQSFFSNQQTLNLPDISQSDPTQPNLSLYQVLRASYGDKEAAKYLEGKGYTIDTNLSNENVYVFHNSQTNKLLVAVAGTHNQSDVATDLYLAVGALKTTTRYKEAKKILETARETYPNNTVTVAGHSLGGTIASYIGRKSDNIYAYNLGMTIGQPYRKGVKYIRTNTDAVSILGNLASKKNRDVQVINGQLGLLSGHNLENLKDQDLII